MATTALHQNGLTSMETAEKKKIEHLYSQERQRKRFTCHEERPRMWKSVYHTAELFSFIIHFRNSVREIAGREHICRHTGTKTTGMKDGRKKFGTSESISQPMKI